MRASIYYRPYVIELREAYAKYLKEFYDRANKKFS